MQINKLRRIDEVNIYCFEILFVHVNILADISRCFSQILADVFSQILADVFSQIIEDAFSQIFANNFFR